MKYIVILIVLIAIGGGFYYMKGPAPTNESVINTDSTMPTVENSSTTEMISENATGTPKKSGFSLADISSHKDATSCWSAVNGKVYDLTSWIGKHPGGDKAILSICGKDGTASFMKKHAGSEEAKAQLPNFLIGDLITQ